jgi:hypothetical protein
VNVTGFNLTSVGAYFDTLAMAGHSEYQQTPSGLEFPYDKILVSGLVGGLRSFELAYDLTGFSTTLSSGYLAFYITVRSQPPSSFSDGQVIIDYDTLAFGTNIASASSYYGLSFNDAYTLSDYSPYQLLININNVTSQTTFDPVSNTPDSLLILYLPISDCTQAAQVGIDQGTDTLTSDYYDTGISGTVLYDQIDALYGSDPNIICPPPIPTIDSLSTYCINAGSFEVLKIYGSNFGTDTGTVYFNNANNNGTFIPTYPQDIRLWTDHEIDLLVPSDPYVAASGVFYIVATNGADNQAQGNIITIGYANVNVRDGHGNARFAFLDTAFVFQLDTFLFNTPGVKASILQVMADMNCLTGVNFQLDTTAPSVATIPRPLDHINLISVQSDTFAFFASNPTVASNTSLDSRYQSCPNSLPQYNNSAVYQYDIDI